MTQQIIDHNFMLKDKNHLIGIGYESNRKDQFWWLTIYKSVGEDFENIMHFINDYYEERKAPTA